jgi:hypothetical protein
MLTKHKIILFLLFIPPIMGEFFTGNKFNLIYNPMAFLFFYTISFLLYGCGTLLIRELKARWNLQWSIMFLLIAYGIFEEAFTTKAIFNPEWAGVGAFAGYGMYFGVQWIWAIGVIFAHATISTLFAIVVSDYLWPEYRNKPLLKKKGMLLATVGILTVGIFGYLIMGASEGDVAQPFVLSAALTIATIASISLLVYLAYSFRNSRFASKGKLLSPFYFGLVAFLFPAFFLFSYILPTSNVPATTALAIYAVVLFSGFLFVRNQIYNVNVTAKHITAAVFGMVLFYVALAPAHELVFGHTGITILLLAVLFLVWRWRRKVIKMVPPEETRAISPV